MIQKLSITILASIMLLNFTCETKSTSGKKQVATSKKYIDLIYDQDYENALKLYDSVARIGMTLESYKNRASELNILLQKYGKNISKISGHSEGLNNYIVEMEIEQNIFLKFVYAFDGNEIINILIDTKNWEDKKHIPFSTPEVKYEKIVSFYQNWVIHDTLYEINTVSFVKPANDSVGIVAIKVITNIPDNTNKLEAKKKGFPIAKYALDNGIVDLVRSQINESTSKYFGNDIGIVFWNPETNYFYFVLIPYDELIESS